MSDPKPFRPIPEFSTIPTQYFCKGECGTLGEFHIDRMSEAREGLELLRLLISIARCPTCGSNLGVRAAGV